MNPAMRKTVSRHAVAARVAARVAIGVIAPLLLGGCVIAAAPMGGRPQIVKAAPAPASGPGPVQKGAADAADAAAALALRGDGARDANDLVRAISYYRRARALDPGRRAYRVRLGAALRDLTLAKAAVRASRPAGHALAPASGPAHSATTTRRQRKNRVLILRRTDRASAAERLPGRDDAGGPSAQAKRRSQAWQDGAWQDGAQQDGVRRDGGVRTDRAPVRLYPPPGARARTAAPNLKPGPEKYRGGDDLSDAAAGATHLDRDSAQLKRRRFQEVAEDNFAAFKRLLPELTKSHPGEYALMREGRAVGFFATAGAAMVEGHRSYPDRLFSIQRVVGATAG